MRGEDSIVGILTVLILVALFVTTAIGITAVVWSDMVVIK